MKKLLTFLILLLAGGVSILVIAIGNYPIVAYSL